MSLKDVISPERIALASAYTEEEAREEAFAIMRDADFYHLEHCRDTGCLEGCPARGAQIEAQGALALVREYEGVSCKG